MAGGWPAHRPEDVYKRQAQVQPAQIGSLQRGEDRAGQPGLHLFAENGVAFSHIIQHRIQPCIAMSEGRFGSGHAEDVAGYHASVTQRFFQAVQQRPVAAESGRLLQTRQVPTRPKAAR